MKNDGMSPPCGLLCGECKYLGKQCDGCGNVKGKPFWTIKFKIEVCPIYDCCVNKKGLEHCGQCDEFPCKIFIDLKDPSMSDEEFEKSLNARKNELTKRKDENG
ncbi:MAG: DUF3795 domain-containing protein [Candidatus Peribacteraceae bacterium]|nr:DUF3795 domain-containing protein [Candidatus Peribacteraceae bacterium]